MRAVTAILYNNLTSNFVYNILIREGNSLKKVIGVLVGNFRKQPKRHQNLVWWAWLKWVFTPKSWVPILKQHMSYSDIFRLNAQKVSRQFQRWSFYILAP